MFFALCDLAVSFLLFACGFRRVIRTRDRTSFPRKKMRMIPGRETRGAEREYDEREGERQGGES